MLKIRLCRKGSNQKPFYRVVVSDSQRTPRARVVDMVGHYNPAVDPAKIRIDLARIDHWIERGAAPSETVRSLITRARKSAPAAS